MYKRQTLTATLDGKKLPEGTRCSWTAVEGEEYFKLEKNEFRSDQITVNINTLAKEQQKIKVKAEVDGVEQEIEFIPWSASTRFQRTPPGFP